jgi:hypothetical protein
LAALHAAQSFRRLAHREDPWKNIGRRASSLRTARRRLDELVREEGVA